MVGRADIWMDRRSAALGTMGAGPLRLVVHTDNTATGDGSPGRRWTAAGDARSGAHGPLRRNRLCRLVALGEALVARLVGLFVWLALCGRKSTKVGPSLVGGKAGLALRYHRS